MKVSPCFAAQIMLLLFKGKALPELDSEIKINTIQWLKHKALLTKESELTNKGERITKGIRDEEIIVIYFKRIFLKKQIKRENQISFIFLPKT
ncbi:hypothetical protein K0B03_01610 [Patescibacteria group bacterium]|nr:hypothetical protein [Patescibacteria group bacterium]